MDCEGLAGYVSPGSLEDGGANGCQFSNVSMPCRSCQSWDLGIPFEPFEVRFNALPVMSVLGPAPGGCEDVTLPKCVSMPCRSCQSWDIPRTPEADAGNTQQVSMPCRSCQSWDRASSIPLTPWRLLRPL